MKTAPTCHSDLDMQARLWKAKLFYFKRWAPPISCALPPPPHPPPFLKLSSQSVFVWCVHVNHSCTTLSSRFIDPSFDSKIYVEQQYEREPANTYGRAVTPPSTAFLSVVANAPGSSESGIPSEVDPCTTPKRNADTHGPTSPQEAGSSFLSECVAAVPSRDPPPAPTHSSMCCAGQLLNPPDLHLNDSSLSSNTSTNMDDPPTRLSLEEVARLVAAGLPVPGARSVNVVLAMQVSRSSRCCFCC